MKVTTRTNHNDSKSDRPGHADGRRLAHGFPLAVWVIALATGVLSWMQPAHSAEPPVTIRDHHPFQMATTVPPGFTLAAVGDIIIERPISQTPSFAPVGRLIKDADVAFGNFEGTILEPGEMTSPVEAETGGGAIIDTPEVAADLKKIGFDLVGRANNHALDVGVAGMRSTTEALHEAGLVQAGVGMSQSQARSPGFLVTSKGTVGLISVAASFTSLSRSGPPTPGEPPRPGVNALRTTEYHLVSASELHALKELRQEQPAGSIDPVPNEAPDDPLRLFGVHYMVGDDHGFHYKMNKSDLHDILLNVENAKMSSDFVVVSIHAHMPGTWSQVPADFEQAFAHAAIDNGADEFVAHGPHQLRGIEIYKGRPIFYSLGNFVFQIDINQHLESDIYASNDLDPSAYSAADVSLYYDERDFADPNFYQSVVAVSKFGPHGVTEIKLTPIDMDYTGRMADRGVPHLASPAMAHTILERLKRLSQPFGTDVEIVGNVGIIRPSDTQDQQRGQVH